MAIFIGKKPTLINQYKLNSSISIVGVTNNNQIIAHIVLTVM